ncbi:MAG TPA: hypothetical protein VLQ68_05700 [Rhizobiaceae bacterium]|nr:hypothetical protein [Rhizobiaceae bacterium]
MRIALVIAAIADIALGVLLVAVSGFILQGVNNTGPQMPEAIYLVAMIVLCFAAPLLGFALRNRLPAPATLAIAFSPMIIVAAVLLLEPVLV